MKENITAKFNVLLKILNNMYLSQKFINFLNLQKCTFFNLLLKILNNAFITKIYKFHQSTKMYIFSIFFQLLKHIFITEFERTNCTIEVIFYVK
jgi:hypothetical protein